MLYIRRATAQDAQTIAAIQGEAWRQAYRELLPPESLEKLGSTEYWLEYWEKELKAPQADHYIALEGFQAVGFFSLGEPRDEDREEGSRELLLIYFAPDHWRKGYGTQCMSFILSNVREGGYQKLVLWALKGNLIGVSFYTKLGFLQDGRERQVLPDSPVTEVRFYKTLS